jgi:[protein-PII] uridylyltransferase
VTAAGRETRTEEADRLCRSAFSAAVTAAGTPKRWSRAGGGPGAGVALVAVGGYGRRELAPFSDLDVVLVHDDSVGAEEVAEVAGGVWYPLWDAKVRLDHAVRTLPEVTRAAADDVRVALGMLDARHVAGDAAVTLRLRADVLSRWRRDADANLPRLRELVAQRSARTGELAHASVPDLKDSLGGLRDATILKALVATWLVDVPHTDLERSRLRLLDVRDLVQQYAGRAGDRIVPELWRPLAEGLGFAPGPEGEQEAQRHVREVGRRITHLSRLTWSRVDRLLGDAADRPAAGRSRGVARTGRAPHLQPVGRGVAVADGEVVLSRDADLAGDPGLLLRAAAVAAERGLVLSPPSAARLARRGADLPTPWPAEARDSLVRLLAAGSGLLTVWETLDETEALDRMLPEWQRIRLLPHASAVHRFTVDRHVVETCVEASRLIRGVARPDLLLVAALLHDIGKGGVRDHSVAGEPLAAGVAARIGLDPDDARVVATLVRHHLLLATTATTRDLGDPATIELVVGRVGDRAVLDLLAALTEADARATSPQAWTTWRAGLVADLVGRVRAALELGSAPPAYLLEPGGATVEEQSPPPRRTGPQVDVETGRDGARIRVTAADRIGLMADVSGTLTSLRLPIRSARAWTAGRDAVSEWEVAEPEVDAAVVAQRLVAVRDGLLDPMTRVRPGRGTLPPSVLVHHGASREATVLEVRTEDVRGVVYLACRALSDLDLSLRSAHVTTLGPQALDVFYVQEPGAGALTDERAASAVHAVRRVLERAATLDA